MKWPEATVKVVDHERSGVQQYHSQYEPLAEPSVNACPLPPQQHGQPED